MIKAKQELLRRLAEGEIEAFFHAERILQCDRDMMLAAVAVDGDALAYAPPVLRRDREIVLKAVSSNGEALQHASRQMACDREIALVAVRQNGGALAYVDEELTHDREIVLTAIAESGWALAFAADQFRQDRDIVLAAIAQEPQVLQCAAEGILGDAAFATEARQYVYFFRIVALSGRSCIVAGEDEDDNERAHAVRCMMLMESCSKLGLEHSVASLVYGVELVPDFTCIHSWPGSPIRGSVTDYQLVLRSSMVEPF
mmetsp:Transcript_22206/g.50721  ORF Transcript_22206/g.50721 Transcript_22206/m.50721 type:complete len:257 (-) Transcript_22206:125-895(-)